MKNSFPITKYDGVIEKFIGDAVIVLFFEKGGPDYLERSVNCSIAVMEELENWNASRKKRGELSLQNGIGIACGEIDFAFVGGVIKRHLHCSGEAVTLSEVMEAETKQGMHSKIFLDPEIASSLEGQFDFGDIEIEAGLIRKEVSFD